MDNNLRRIALQPVNRVRQGARANENNNNNNNNNNVGRAVAAQAAAFIATLSPRPRDLHLLWLEYEFGVGRRKPARQFTSIERGRVKFKYCQRKVVWDCIDRLARSGYTAQTAIDKIYDVYGQTTVTRIIERMRHDATGGGHPALQ
jgi:hypothetical protein